MSHFTVLVPAKDEDELEKKLLPYHEYECTGIKEYLEFVPTDMEEAKEDYEKYGKDYDSYEQFMREWFGAHQNDDGVWGRMTNPNAKWDWWVIGGRWQGQLPVNGKGVNQAQKKDIHWETSKGLNAASARKKWRLFNNEEMDVKEKQIEILRNYDGLLDTDEWKELETLSEEEYVEKNGNASAITFAFIDLEGKWNQRGEMGWWGMVSDKQNDYDSVFWSFIESLPNDQNLYVVDCHI